MAYWLLKTEPGTYGWDDLVELGTDHWDGVRNYQARNNLKAMKVGDKALFYHSGKTREVVGEVEIVRAAYQDPTTDDERWVAVDVKPLGKLGRPVSLKEIKADEKLQEIMLVTHSRLSVMPLKAAEYKRILKLSKSA